MAPNSSPRWVFPSVSIRVLLLSEFRPQPATHSAPLIKLFQWKLHSGRATLSILRKPSARLRTRCLQASGERLNWKQSSFLFSFVIFHVFLCRTFKKWLDEEEESRQVLAMLRLHRNCISFWLQVYQYWLFCTHIKSHGNNLNALVCLYVLLRQKVRWRNANKPCAFYIERSKICRRLVRVCKYYFVPGSVLSSYFASMMLTLYSK